MQRVVAGTLRGRKLLALPRSVTGVRPSSSRVRAAIFDRLQHETRGARVLDLFAGSGALAIEALSRGAAHATLVEQHRPLHAFLDRQLRVLGLAKRSTVVRGDARRFLTRPREPASPPFDLVLVDPPYVATELYASVLAALVDPSHSWLAEDAVVVMEYQRLRGQRPAIPVPGALRSEAVRDHGQTSLEFLRHLPEPP